MNKRLLLSVVFASAATLCFSQKVNNQNVLSFSAGVAVPMGDYASTNQSNDQSGYAKTGEHLNIEFEHKLNNHFGLIAVLHGETSGLNTNKLAQQLSQAKFAQGVYTVTDPNNPPPTPQYESYPNFKADKHSWYTEALLVGAATHLPLGTANKLFFTARAAVGAAHVTSPRLNASSVTDTAAAYINQNSSAAFGFAYMAGAGLEYKLNNKFALAFGIDYFGTKVTFKQVTETATFLHGFNIPGMINPGNANSISQYKTTSDQKQPLASVNIHAGVTFTL